ncbi:hypothetical protein pipiens_008014 [Culex pipiens pipiens]|uniref:Uncharacterized protein n=1 Tax=Culex pipiens pipiens TaxID=38569 RepID=A0ABD1DIW2_CULPP
MFKIMTVVAAATMVVSGVTALQAVPVVALTGNGSIVLSNSNVEVMDLMVKKFFRGGDRILLPASTGAISHDSTARAAGGH